MFGPPGGGKSHLAAAIGLALIENGWRVLFMRTTELVQKLQVARRELQLESAIATKPNRHGQSRCAAGSDRDSFNDRPGSTIAKTISATYRVRRALLPMATVIERMGCRPAPLPGVVPRQL